MQGSETESKLEALQSRGLRAKPWGTVIFRGCREKEEPAKKPERGQ